MDYRSCINTVMCIRLQVLTDNKMNFFFYQRFWKESLGHGKSRHWSAVVWLHASSIAWRRDTLVWPSIIHFLSLCGENIHNGVDERKVWGQVHMVVNCGWAWNHACTSWAWHCPTQLKKSSNHSSIIFAGHIILLKEALDFTIAMKACTWSVTMFR